MGVSNVGGVGKNHDFQPISGLIGSMTSGVRATIAMVHRTVYCTEQRILFITACSMDDHNEEKRTEQNLIVHSGKCEAEVTNN